MTLIIIASTLRAQGDLLLQVMVNIAKPFSFSFIHYIFGKGDEVAHFPES